MDSFEFNKIAGAILGTLLLVMGLGIVAETIFFSEDMETPGYVVDVPEDGSDTQTAAAPTEEPIAVLLASATADDGESVAKKCAACHSFDEGGANKVGPNLWNIVNATPAARDGFKYSAAMEAYGDENVWAYENLNNFLAAPKKYLKGTSMGFVGLKKPDERADMIAYLRSLSNAPAALPVVEPAAAEMPADDAATEEAAGEAAPAAETTDAPSAEEPAAAETAEPEAAMPEATAPEAAMPETNMPETNMEAPAAEGTETMEEAAPEAEETAPDATESSETPAN
ncbi:cytochrome c family protein [Pararhizobium sp. IMCC21322]|uniref:c-type cytochrome n=1 Tax=Pararhizobium sp. IMCC21322 TaxID=3067903 RepID=UPI0027410557|nr:cytochrome c family protein [Pararhizobium sp. IMCC21322]